MTLKEIAARIDAHLKRFEGSELKAAYGQFYNTYSEAERRWVYISYSPYRCDVKLTKVEAASYLAWLDAGNVGQHWEVLREKEFTRAMNKPLTEREHKIVDREYRKGVKSLKGSP